MGRDTSPTPPPRTRSIRGSTSRQVPPDYDTNQFTSKENQEWFEAHEYKDFIKGSTSRQVPPDYDTNWFTSKENQK